MSSRRILLRTVAICFGLVGLPVLAAMPFVAAHEYKLPTVQAAQQAASKCSMQNWGQDQVATAGPETICFESTITAEASKRFLSLPIKDGATLVLRSRGGDASAALDMADAILAKHLVAVVDTLCASACANYLFTAAAAKIVLAGGVVGFHGAPDSSWGWTYNGPPAYRALAFADFQAYFKKLADRQARFFASIGVKSSLASDSPLIRYASQFQFKTSLWEYGPNTLRDRFGVKNIIYFQTPDQADLLTRLRASWLVFDCRLDNQDVYFCKAAGF